MSTESQISSLFPAGVSLAVRYDPGDPADLLPAEAIHVAKARAKRINEFAAGRACARQALASFGVADAVLPAAPDRQPVWPAGFVGSITHTAGFCAAAVVPRSKFLSLGLDAEQSGAPSEDIWTTLCGVEELTWVESLPGAERAAAVTLIFSAKEAVYKCQYPVTGQWLDFHDLRITVPDWGSPLGTFDVAPTRPITISAQSELPRGRYCFHRSLIVTALSIAAR